MYLYGTGSAQGTCVPAILLALKLQEVLVARSSWGYSIWLFREGWCTSFPCRCIYFFSDQKSLGFSNHFRPRPVPWALLSRSREEGTGTCLGRWWWSCVYFQRTIYRAKPEPRGREASPPARKNKAPPHDRRRYLSSMIVYNLDRNTALSCLFLAMCS